MPLLPDTTQESTDPAGPESPVVALAALLLRIEAHERTGLSPRCAVLAAGSELGIDPAAIVGHANHAASEWTG